MRGVYLSLMATFALILLVVIGQPGAYRGRHRALTPRRWRR